MKYKLVACLIAPYLQDENVVTEEYIKDYERFSDVKNCEDFIMKYPIESNVVESFDTDCDYVLDDDADGIYLFEKL